MALLQYVTIAKAAKITGIPVTKIYRYIHTGELKVHRNNGELEINIQDLLRKKSTMNDGELLEPAFMNFISKVKKETK